MPDPDQKPAKGSNRNEPKDALLRHWAMLQLIPRAPRKITTQQLRDQLARENPLYNVHQRTIERNLIQIMEVFKGLDYDEVPATGQRGRPRKRWFWRQDELMSLPALDARTALLFRLVETFLTPLFPPGLLEEFQPHFGKARAVLRGTQDPGYSRWPEKVRVIQNSQRLLQPNIEPGILDVVYTALFKERRFLARYQTRGGNAYDYEVSPRGLVFRDGLIYCVCSLSDRPGLRQLPLHRMRQATPLDLPQTPLPGFDLDQYVKEAFDYPLHALRAHQDPRHRIPVTLPLRIAVTAASAVHLREAPLSRDQSVSVRPDGRVEFAATVANTQRLRWWLLGYGDQLEVLGPPELREEIAAITGRMQQRYASA